LALACSAVAIFVWVGSQRQSAGPDAGVSFQGKATVGQVQSSETFRVGTFNIHSGRGRDGRTDLFRIAELLRPADFVCLNEVRGAAPFAHDDQAGVIAGALECAWLFAPAEQRWWNQFYGNAAVSDLAVKSWQRIPLPRKAAKSFRNVVLVTADLGGQAVSILCTHLERSSTADRAAQLQAVTNLFLSLGPPAILAGDTG
jgi:endonuclease/exonuclease/phosphatase family metal-dependent hydrolase